MKKLRLFAAAIAVTALALTGCSSSKKETEAPKETQAKETQAPETQAKETQAPETQAPETQAKETEAAVAAETEAAVAETEAAVVETEAAAVETEAAAVETEAAVEETEAAVEETEAAVEETEATVEETEAAVEETEAAVEETEAAVEETEAAVEETEAAVEETEAAVEETEAAVEETEAAVEETEAAVEETEAAIEETEVAVEETEAAVEETEAAVEETEAAAETEAESGIMTYEEYAEAEPDTLVTIEAFVQGKQKFYADNKEIGTSTVTLYAQDENGGYFLYNVPVTESDYARIKEGTKIRFTGYKSEWAGEVEIVPDSLEPIEVIRGGIYISKPVDVTDVLGDEDQLAEYMNQRVSFTGMTVEPNYAVEEETETATEAEEGNETEAETEGAELAFMYGWDGSGSEGDDLYFNASVDGKVYTFVVESNLCDENSEVYQTVKNLKVGDQIDMEGFLYWYEGAQPHIISVTLPEEEE